MTRQMTALGHSSVIESAEVEILLRQLQASMARQSETSGGTGGADPATRSLGVPTQECFVSPMHSRLPKNLIDFEAIERDAIQNRLDVQIARQPRGWPKT